MNGDQDSGAGGGGDDGDDDDDGGGSEGAPYSESQSRVAPAWLKDARPSTFVCFCVVSLPSFCVCFAFFFPLSLSLSLSLSHFPLVSLSLSLWLGEGLLSVPSQVTFNQHRRGLNPANPLVSSVTPRGMGGGVGGYCSSTVVTAQHKTASGLCGGALLEQSSSRS